MVLSESTGKYHGKRASGPTVPFLYWGNAIIKTVFYVDSSSVICKLEGDKVDVVVRGLANSSHLKE